MIAVTTAVVAVVSVSAAPMEAQAAREAGWDAVKPIVVKLLRKHLNKWEIKRLLKKRYVRRALVAALKGYDGGVEDRILVRREGRTIKLVFVDRERRRICIDLGKTPETGDKPACEEKVETKDTRVVSLDPGLWKKPKKKKPPEKPPETPPKMDPKKPESVLFGGYARKEAKEKLAMLGISSKVVQLVAGYWGFRDQAKGVRTLKDPFETKFQVGDKLDPVKLKGQPKPKPIGSVEGNAMENLRYIYDVSRMRPAWPVPDPFGLYARPTHRTPGDPIAVAKPDRKCLKSFKDTHNPKRPPTLDCFTKAVRFRNLDKDQAYQVAKWVSTFVPLPILEDIMKQRVREKTYESVSTYLWAHTWMQWARRNPAKVGPTLDKMSDKERMQLRWRLSRWWFDRQYTRFEPAIAAIYEQHFHKLYPNAKDRHGWPRRSRFKDDYLWALNWMAASERTPTKAVEAHDRLTRKGKAIIAALLADTVHKKRFPKTAAAVARRSM